MDAASYTGIQTVQCNAGCPTPTPVPTAEPTPRPVHCNDYDACLGKCGTIQCYVDAASFKGWKTRECYEGCPAAATPTPAPGDGVRRNRAAILGITSEDQTVSLINLVSGALYDVFVEVQNTGDNPWPVDGDYALAVVGGGLIQGNTRYELPGVVRPGDTVRVKVRFVAPLLPPNTAVYADFQMVQESTAPFGQVGKLEGRIVDRRPPPSITLVPNSGTPGTHVTAYRAGGAGFIEGHAEIRFSFGDPQGHPYSLVHASSHWESFSEISFTVPADAGCGIHYAAVLSEFGESNAAGFTVTGPCDPTTRNTLDVMSYNIQFLTDEACCLAAVMHGEAPLCAGYLVLVGGYPGLIPWADLPEACSCAKDFRGPLLANNPKLRGHDVVVFEEAFSDSHVKELRDGLRFEYPYQTTRVGRAEWPWNGGFDSGGGVFIASRWPIQEVNTELYADCSGTIAGGNDCLANKGVVRAKIDKGGAHYHVFGTHLDSGDGNGDGRARVSQLQQLWQFIRLFAGSDGNPALIAGDLNINKNGSDGEYEYMVSRLNASFPSSAGGASFTSRNKEKWLDYVLYANHHLKPTSSTIEVVEPTVAGDTPFHYPYGSDLSDHLAVVGRFLFPFPEDLTDPDLPPIGVPEPTPPPVPFCSLACLDAPGSTIYCDRGAAGPGWVQCPLDDTATPSPTPAATPTPTPSGDVAPVGDLDVVAATYAAGWACDANNYAAALSVHIYLDGPAGTGRFVGVATANVPRDTAVGNRCGGNPNHGYEFVFPETVRDGQTHTVYAYAIDHGGAINPLLNGAPRSVTLAPAGAIPIGWLDQVDADAIMGWACDRDTPERSIAVHVYFGGPAGQGTIVEATVADRASEPGVAAACGGGTAHRFSLPMSPALKSRLGVGTFAVYAYGINTNPAGDNAELLGCPKTLAITSLMTSEPVVWRNRVGVSASGTTLTKTNPTWEWNAGAVSDKWILSGDGYAEFNATDHAYGMFGLSNGDRGPDYNDIDFAVYLLADGTFAVMEGGNWRGVMGSYQSGDLFRVAVAGGSVRYSRNGAVFYDSGVQASYPLLVDTSLLKPDTTISNGVIAAVSLGKAAPRAGLGLGYDAYVGEPVTFVGYDSDGIIAQYDWDFGDPFAAPYLRTDVPEATHTYAIAGTYTARLTVTDVDGATQTSTVSVTIRAPQVSSPVSWTRQVNTTVVGNELRRPSGNGWDAGATSTRRIASGDGYVQAVAGELGTYRMFGLSHDDTDQSYTDIDYAIYLTIGPQVYIVEGGAPRVGGGTYKTGDVFRVEVRNGTVRYLQNGRILYVSTVAPTYPLLVDTSIANTGGTVKAARMAPVSNAAPLANANSGYTGMPGVPVAFSAAGSSDSDGTIVSYSWSFSDGGGATGSNPAHAFSAAGDYSATLTVTDDEGMVGTATVPVRILSSGSVVWRNLVGVSGSASTLTKTDSTWSWDAGAVSQKALLSGDGYLEFAAEGTSSWRMCGLSNGNSSANYVDIDFAIYLIGDGTFAVFEGGNWRGIQGNYASGDRFRVEVDAGVVQYKRNGMTFYTSTLAPTYPLLVDTSLLNPGAALSEVALVAAALGKPVPVAKPGRAYEGFVGESLQFDGRESDGVLVRHDWAFGDGATGIGSNAVQWHRYASPGTYWASLTVVDDEGRASTETVPVTIRMPLAVTPVTWTSAVNTTLVADELRKTIGVSDEWNSGAVSTQRIAAGDGYVEIVASETSTYRMFGLSNGDTDQGQSDLDYGLYPGGGAILYIYERGAYRGMFGSYQAGDALRVEVRAGVVRYLKNGRVLYSSGEAPIYPLLVDTSFYSAGASLKGTVISTEPVPRAALWSSAFAADARETTAVGDFNGDGRTDIVKFGRNNPSVPGDVHVALSTGSQFGPAQKWRDWFAASPDETIVIGDFDGDGKDDMATWLRTSSREVYVVTSTGNGLSGAAIWIGDLGASADVLLAGDANGDGLEDLIGFARTDGRVYVALSTGESFAGPMQWHNSFSTNVYARPRVADVNGDGKADIAVFSTNSPSAPGDVHVALSDGSRFGDGWSSAKWHDSFAADPSEALGFGDSDGDGVVDFFTFLPTSGSGSCFTGLSSGSSIGRLRRWHENIRSTAVDQPFVGDVNGDGRADVIVFSRGDGKVYVSIGR